LIPVLVVHLPNVQRKAQISAELDRAGFTDVTFVAAQEPCKTFTMSNMRRNPRAEFGCSLSHLKALNVAHSDYQFYQKSEESSPVLIIEDDVVFVDGALEMLSASIELMWKMWLRSNLPEWEIIYLGGHPRGPVSKFANGIYKVSTFSCAEAYVVNPFCIPYIFNFWLDRIGQPNAMWDFILGEYVANHGTGYAIYPTLTHQPPGWSQIGQKHDDKRELIAKGWQTHLAA
jgi:hypothetical protein